MEILFVQAPVADVPCLVPAGEGRGGEGFPSGSRQFRQRGAGIDFEFDLAVRAEVESFDGHVAGGGERDPDSVGEGRFVITRHGVFRRLVDQDRGFPGREGSDAQVAARAVAPHARISVDRETEQGVLFVVVAGMAPGIGVGAYAHHAVRYGGRRVVLAVVSGRGDEQVGVVDSPGAEQCGQPQEQER